MGNMSDVWDWNFMWSTFGFILKLVSPFIMIIIAIIAVGLLLKMVIHAVKTRGT